MLRICVINKLPEAIYFIKQSSLPAGRQALGSGQMQIFDLTFTNTALQQYK